MSESRQLPPIGDRGAAVGRPGSSPGNFSVSSQLAVGEQFSVGTIRLWCDSPITLAPPFALAPVRPPAYGAGVFPAGARRWLKLSQNSVTPTMR